MNVAINWAGLTESHSALTEDEMRSWRLLPSRHR